MEFPPTNGQPTDTNSQIPTFLTVSPALGGGPGEQKKGEGVWKPSKWLREKQGGQTTVALHLCCSPDPPSASSQSLKSSQINHLYHRSFYTFSIHPFYIPSFHLFNHNSPLSYPDPIHLQPPTIQIPLWTPDFWCAPLSSSCSKTSTTVFLGSYPCSTNKHLSIDHPIKSNYQATRVRRLSWSQKPSRLQWGVNHSLNWETANYPILTVHHIHTFIQQVHYTVHSQHWKSLFDKQSVLSIFFNFGQVFCVTSNTTIFFFFNFDYYTTTVPLQQLLT